MKTILFYVNILILICACLLGCKSKPIPEGMVWIPPGEFIQGAVHSDPMAMAHEKPAHKVSISGFFMDATEVTNAQFKKFVTATNYITIAERDIDWNEMKKQLPIGTPKPHDSILQAGALTFKSSTEKLNNLYDFSQWWRWTVGANWKHPQGPNSTIEGKEQHPVVHIAYQDALAYCEWAGRSLPTEAQWEYAARGQQDGVYSWGTNGAKLSEQANTWEGSFPDSNSMLDGFLGTAAVGSFPANPFGLYDMSGNVWEWTSDWYNTTYYKTLAKQNEPITDPKGAPNAYNPNNPYTPERVIKGGSFLCNASYCASYRISARMASTEDSASEHIGFRTVLNVK